MQAFNICKQIVHKQEVPDEGINLLKEASSAPTEKNVTEVSPMDQF